MSPASEEIQKKRHYVWCMATNRFGQRCGNYRYATTSSSVSSDVAETEPETTTFLCWRHDPQGRRALRNA
jgi:hypothetical protein